MQTVKEYGGYKLMFDSKNCESTILNSKISYYREFYKGNRAAKEIEEVKDMSNLSFVVYCVGQMFDKYQKEEV